MTQNEVSIIKNSVLDATEAYVDARLNMADFVKTQIGVTQGNPTNRNGKYYHKVKCNATSGSGGILYNDVLSVGNIEFPANSVVFLIAPNAQYSNQFILGKLDTSPCNIVGGSIKINDKFYVDKDGNLFVGGTTTATAPFYVTNAGVVSIKSGSININNKFFADANGNLYVGGVNTNSKFYVTNAGEIHSSSGYIGGFHIDSTHIGDETGSSTCIGMKTGSKLFAWTSSNYVNIYPSFIEMQGSSCHVQVQYGGSWVNITTGNIQHSTLGYVLWEHGTSDKRYKKDIKEISTNKIRKFFKEIQPSTFTFDTEKLKDKNDLNHYGVIAQNLQSSLEKADLKTDNIIKKSKTEDMLLVNYQELHGLELAGIKDLYNQIDALKKQIEANNNEYKH